MNTDKKCWMNLEYILIECQKKNPSFTCFYDQTSGPNEANINKYKYKLKIYDIYNVLCR